MKNQPEQTMQVVILGGGYAGMMTALRLAGKVNRENVRITLVNGHSHFTERIRLHQIATNQTLPHRPYTQLLAGTNIRFVSGLATEIEPHLKTVTIKTETRSHVLRYDYLVYALGSTVDMDSVPGVADFAESLADLTATERIQRSLPEINHSAGQVLIVGGGLTGIEAATEIAEAYPQLRVTLLTRGVLGNDLSQKGAAYLKTTCERLGIQCLEQKTVRQITYQQACCHDGALLPFDLCLWAGAFRVPTLAQASHISTDSQRRIIVDESLRSVSHPDIYAVGDAAQTSLRMACATAMPMGCYAADHLATQLNNDTILPPFQFAYAMRCISLGRNDALIQMVDADDSPKEKVVTGRMAVWVKELICRFTIWAILLEKRLPGAYRWPKAQLKGQHTLAKIVTS